MTWLRKEVIVRVFFNSVAEEFTFILLIFFDIVSIRSVIFSLAATVETFTPGVECVAKPYVFAVFLVTIPPPEVVPRGPE